MKRLLLSLSLSDFSPTTALYSGKTFPLLASGSKYPLRNPKDGKTHSRCSGRRALAFFFTKRCWRKILASQGNSRHHCVRYLGRQFYFSERCLSQICRFKLFDLAIRFESDLPRDLHPHQILGPKKKIHFDSIRFDFDSNSVLCLFTLLAPYPFPISFVGRCRNPELTKPPPTRTAFGISGSFPSLFFSRQNEFDLFKFQRFGLDFISAALDRLLSPQFYFARPKCSSRFP